LKLINFLLSEYEAALMTKYENQLQRTSIAVCNNKFNSNIRPPLIMAIDFLG